MLPGRASEKADGAAGLGRELEAACRREVEAGRIDDDGDGGAAAEREIGGPEALRGRGGGDEQGASQEIAFRSVCAGTSAERGGVGPDGTARTARSCDPDDARLGVVGLGERAVGETDEEREGG